MSPHQQIWFINYVSITLPYSMLYGNICSMHSAQCAHRTHNNNNNKYKYNNRRRIQCSAFRCIIFARSELMLLIEPKLNDDIKHSIHCYIQVFDFRFLSFPIILIILINSLLQIDASACGTRCHSLFHVQILIPKCLNAQCSYSYYSNPYIYY